MDVVQQGCLPLNIPNNTSKAADRTCATVAAVIIAIGQEGSFRIVRVRPPRARVLHRPQRHQPCLSHFAQIPVITSHKGCNTKHAFVHIRGAQSD